MRELFDVVHQAKKQPLAVHFRAAVQREAIQPFVIAHIGKHRFDRGEPSPVLFASLGRIEALLQAHRVRLGSAWSRPRKKATLLGSTAANAWAMSSRSVLTTCAMVVTCGAVIPHNAMSVTCAWAHALDRPTAHNALRVLDRGVKSAAHARHPTPITPRRVPFPH